MILRHLLAITLLTFLQAAHSVAQNPIQWQSSARAAIDRAAEQSMPLMFWITEREEAFDDDDLRDAQEHAFRDPAVVALAQKRFIPVRLSRSNSRVMEEARKLGLPADHGLYIAILSPEGKVIETINPGQVADPQALAVQLHTALRRYLDDLYTRQLQPVIASKEAPKQDIRRAVQTVWRLGILSADKDCIALLDRPDLTAVERRKLTSMLGAMATPACIESLLNLAASGDKDAIAALAQAEAGALETLLKELPRADSTDAPTARQLAAYSAACRIARTQAKPDTFWSQATSQQRAESVDSLRRRAEPILEYWNENAGRWR